MMNKIFFTLPLLFTLMVGQSEAAVALDRTRVIYPGDAKSISLTIRNTNKTLPYLAQAWLEDIDGNKVNSPFTLLPPIQRLEPEMESLVKIQSLPSLQKLPQDKESLFYFNLREVPPRSDKPNTLQLAIQTRIKLFYRPVSLMVDPSSDEGSWQRKVTLQLLDGKYQLSNPTPYYITIVTVSSSTKDDDVEGFDTVMMEPHSSVMVNIEPSKIGKTPVFTYVDDFGGHRKLSYQCTNVCQLLPEKR